MMISKFQAGKSRLLYSVCFLTFASFFLQIQAAESIAGHSQYVNPFIGTGGHGHTFPGATLPFGMVQLSPDTRLSGWDGCSGYHYSDSLIFGFSHTHLSGTGVSDYGDILLMPANRAIFNNGADGNPGYGSRFSHADEFAAPGYYRVFLQDSKTRAELSVTSRAGIHRYTFAPGRRQFVILDLAHRDPLLDFQLHQISETEVSGYRISKAWAKEQHVYFYLKFSKPIVQREDFPSSDAGKILKSAFQFDHKSGEVLEVRIGISAVDIAGARKNLEAEIGNKSFEQIRRAATRAWDAQLGKIKIETADAQQRSVFYTALYHTLLAPNLYQDVDGRYRGMDLKIHQANDFTNYTVFSLWDTYRATHPLFTILEPQRTVDFIKTMIHKYEEGGVLPIWDLSACYTGCMIGYHGVSVIADAYIKGIRDFDAQKAFAAMKHSAMQDHLGLAAYKKLGFIPMEAESESVSKTLEYAYDDWSIAQMARELGKTEDYEYFISRAQNYKNVLDVQSKFMRARLHNQWFTPFDPFEVNFNYTEANSWQYSFYVPQDISGLMKLLGGRQVLENQLDSLFSAAPQTTGRTQVDISGLIGQYAHGNEPSHHIAYLYNFVNRPDKTQRMVRKIMKEFYRNQPDGIAGNEDCGQMSAWFVFSALGFYPVTPGSPDYIIGSPLFPEATIHLNSGNSFSIVAKNLSAQNKYIAGATLNGHKYPYSYLKHGDIMKGGTLILQMAAEPQKWGSGDKNVPRTEIRDVATVPVSYIAAGKIAFRESTGVRLANPNSQAQTYFSFAGNKFQKYQNPFFIDQPGSLAVYAQIGENKSPVIKTNFFKANADFHIKLGSKYSNQYNGGGDNALIDGMLGAEDFRTGSWQGYHNCDVIATVDLGKVREIHKISSRYLRDQRSWIFHPDWVKYEISEDGVHFSELAKYELDCAKENEAVQIIAVGEKFPALKTRYVRLVAKNLGRLPGWHIGYPMGGYCFIFIDELMIK